ncbi:hypothetical protein ACFVT9_31940 [Kitasatospora cineracea]|uniref:hypothetical protein n=1 Tax=Kitasatospora cineracea TaxID=88074 RepID=UPI0036DDDE2A
MQPPFTAPPLTAAFPAELARDARSVLAVMPASRFRPIAPSPVLDLHGQTA